MPYYKKLYPALILFFIMSCSTDEPHPAGDPYPAGVVFTFDDAFADEWCDADEVLSEYNWKATFFIAQYGGFTDEQKNKLYALELHGHEVAGHGYNHLKATTYVAAHGMDRYIQDEIEPMLQVMGNDGFDVKTFAYPYGDRNEQLDNRLLDHFNIIRGTTYGQLPPENQKCFYNGSRLIYGLGIDQSYAHANIAYLKSLMQYAKDHNKIVVFYGHQTVNNVTGEYQTSVERLKELCSFANQLGLRFYKVNELHGLD